MKKRMFAMLMFAMLMGAMTAWAQSDWAIYKNNPVPEDVNVPQKFINEDGTLNCCACHWNTQHDGPQYCE